MQKLFLYLFFGLSFIGIVPGAHAIPVLEEGDLIFQTSRSAQTDAVQQATRSPYSHMGVILTINDKSCVLEASASVRCTPVAEWIARGDGGHFVAKRLKSPESLTLKKNIHSLHALAESYIGLPYDLTFEWNDSRMYCSELVWKLFDRAMGLQIGELSKLEDFDLTAPLVHKKIIERYKGDPPLDEVVISPAAMFSSPLLVEVARE